MNVALVHYIPCKLQSSGAGGGGGRGAGVKGARSVHVHCKGEERAGSRSPKVVESRRKRDKLPKNSNYFKKAQRSGLLYMEGVGTSSTSVREEESSDLPAPHSLPVLHQSINHDISRRELTGSTTRARLPCML